MSDSACVSRMPSWLTRTLPSPGCSFLRSIEESGCPTVCLHAACPNTGECSEQGSATFMILGDTCTRNCRFCAVEKGIPRFVDPEEPAKIASCIRRLGMKHAVVTSVTRDDLADGGAGHFCAVIAAARSAAATVEVLVPDFGGREESVRRVLEAKPDVFGHNVETVPRLYRELRPEADYRRSLSVIAQASSAGLITKSSLMLGLGETGMEVLNVMKDLASSGCHILTLGQYLRPDVSRTPVREFIAPEQFAEYEAAGRNLGFREVVAGPYVRSSFHAGRTFDRMRGNVS